MLVLGLDLALHTGWCVANDDGVVESGVWDYSRLRNAPGTHNGHVFCALWEDMEHTHRAHHLTAIIYERPHHRGGAASRIALGMAGTVLAFAARYKLVVLDVHTKTLKKWATGNALAGKDAMKDKASEIVGRAIESDDEADAIHTALMAWTEAE